jgi:TRAP-type C4-dicarboxylate transport system permease small subunit
MGFISEGFFIALVLSAIFTSIIAGSWFRYLVGRDIPLIEEKTKSN